MRLFFLFFLISFLLIEQVSAAGYFAVNNLSMRMENLHFDENLNAEFQRENAIGFGAEFGFFLTNSAALELGFMASKFKSYEIQGNTPSNYTAKVDGSFSAVTIGMRWYWYEFFNIRFGGIKKEYDPHFTSTGTPFADIEFVKEEEYGNYFGWGLGLTVSKMQIYYDQTLLPNPSGKDAISNALGLKVFF